MFKLFGAPRQRGDGVVLRLDCHGPQKRATQVTTSAPHEVELKSIFTTRASLNWMARSVAGHDSWKQIRAFGVSA